MTRKIALLVLVLVLATVWLSFAAIKANGRNVLTVAELVAAGKPEAKVRVGAKVVSLEDDISAPDSPHVFFATDFTDASRELKVIYAGRIPESLHVGRGVIVEGSYDGEKFIAETLMTQCPSKYEAKTKNPV